MDCNEFLSDAAAVPAWGERRRLRDSQRSKRTSESLGPDQGEEWLAATEYLPLEQTSECPVVQEPPCAPSAAV